MVVEYYHYFGMNEIHYDDKPKKPKKGFRNPRGTEHPIDRRIEKAIQQHDK